MMRGVEWKVSRNDFRMGVGGGRLRPSAENKRTVGVVGLVKIGD